MIKLRSDQSIPHFVLQTPKAGQSARSVVDSTPPSGTLGAIVWSRTVRILREKTLSCEFLRKTYTASGETAGTLRHGAGCRCNAQASFAATARGFSTRTTERGFFMFLSSASRHIESVDSAPTARIAERTDSYGASLFCCNRGLHHMRDSAPI